MERKRIRISKAASVGGFFHFKATVQCRDWQFADIEQALPASLDPMNPQPNPLRNNIRRERILDLADLVAQHQLALFQALHLDQVGAGR